MSTTFLIACVAMVVAALALVLVPLLRNVPGEGKNKAPVPRSVPLAVVLMVSLPLAATAFYGSTSNFPWNNQGLLGGGAGGHTQDGGSMDEVVAQLEERLKKNPGDLEGWRMLGRSYLVSNLFPQAVSAYERASALTGGKDPEIELDLAEALVLVDKPEAQEKAKGIIDAALAANENNQKALWYSGLMAMRAGDNETAKARFTKLLESDPPQQIREILVAQLEKLGAPVPAATPPAGMGGMGGMGAGMGAGSATAPAATEATGRTIRVAVKLDPALAAKLKRGTPVFVSAREAGIPGPPIAAVRITSDELPATVVLSDSNSMIEGRNLSSVDEVQVVARVAFGGTPVTASGDLTGEARHRKGAPADLDVVIDKVAP